MILPVNYEGIVRNLTVSLICCSSLISADVYRYFIALTVCWATSVLGFSDRIRGHNLILDQGRFMLDVWKNFF